MRRNHNASLSHVVSLVVLVSAMMLAGMQVGYAQPNRPDQYRVKLLNRSFTPEPGIQRVLKDSLVAQLSRNEKRHVYVQLRRHLKADERAALQRQGVRLLSYVGGHAWRAVVTDNKVPDFTQAAVQRQSPMLGNLRWVGAIPAADKIQPRIASVGVGAYNRQPDGRVDVIVVFFPDVARDVLVPAVARHGEMLRQPGMLNDVVVRLPEERIQSLAQEDIVQWVEEVGPPDTTHNDGSRTAIGVDQLQVAPHNLNGTNVQVGQWDGGEVDGTHNDLAGRVTVVEAVGVNDHATHVAGTLAGDGNRSAAAGGTANQWRGMATAAQLFSYTFLQNDLEPEEHNDAININGIDLSQNSWGMTGSAGDYVTRSAKYDDVVRGGYGRPLSIVFSAGNNGPGFQTVMPPGGTAKNNIVVGAVNSDNLAICSFSSRGPSDAGQTKPDIVAPGDQSGAAGIVSTIPLNHDEDHVSNATGSSPGDGIDDFFFPYNSLAAGAGEPEPPSTAAAPENSWRGTSMAAPCVSGTIALMLQQYRRTYYGSDNQNGAPLPSTFKAILSHTAQDLVNNPGAGGALTGPDYVYGYGLIDAHAAVDAVANRMCIEGVASEDDDVDLYTVDVAPGDPELRVTLVWDDTAGASGAANVIQNDLDLLLVDPAGTAFFPAWELDPANPGSPAQRNSYATEALAEGHRDDRNVVEQVLVDNPASGTWTIKVKAFDLPFPYQRYSLIAGDQPTQVPTGHVDIVQVLDRSGSMGSQGKIGTLKDAADHFVQMMRPNVGNKLGLVQFNQDVVVFPPAADASLADLTAARATTLRTIAIPSIVPGGTTSIGDGLREAHNQLTGPAADPSHDHVILLVSDGKENTAEWISTVQPDLVSAHIPVYALGLGFGSGIDEEKLTDLADATGGTFRITGDQLVFRKFFIEVLAGAVDWSVITDPIGELAAGGDTLIPVSITSFQTGATFTAYWEGVDNAVQLSMVTPSGRTITPSTANSGLRYGSHARYAFYQFKYPLSGDLAGERAGQWKMKLTGTSSIPSGSKVRYSASAFAEGGEKIKVAFDKQLYLTGDKLALSVRLAHGGKPLTGASIDVVGDVPLVGVGNVLHYGKVDPTDLWKDSTVAGDPVSLPERKLKILDKQAGGNLLKRGTARFRLYDDGRHDDGKAGDGLYAGSFDSTIVPGSYTFRLVATDVKSGERQSTTREWSQSVHVGVNVDPNLSAVELRPVGQTAEGRRYRAVISPRDKFGNFLGPGYPVVAAVERAGGIRKVRLADNLDGTYAGEVLVSNDELRAGAKLSILAGGKLAKTVVTSPARRKMCLF